MRVSPCRHAESMPDTAQLAMIRPGRQDFRLKRDLEDASTAPSTAKVFGVDSSTDLASLRGLEEWRHNLRAPWAIELAIVRAAYPLRGKFGADAGGSIVDRVDSVDLYRTHRRLKWRPAADESVSNIYGTGGCWEDKTFVLCYLVAGVVHTPTVYLSTPIISYPSSHHPSCLPPPPPLPNPTAFPATRRLSPPILSPLRR